MRAKSLVGHVAPIGVIGAGDRKLALEAADAGPEQDAPAGQDINGGYSLGRQHRTAEGHDEDAAAQEDALGDGGGETKNGGGLVPHGAAALDMLGWDGEVLADPDGVEAHGLGLLGDSDDAVGRGCLAEVGQHDAKVHDRSFACRLCRP